MPTEKERTLFFLSNETLKPSGEWQMQIKFALALGLWFVLSGVYQMNATPETKALTLVSFAFVCYASVNLSSNTRNRAEAEKLKKYAKNTPMYNISMIQTLEGSDTKFYFHWFSFFFALALMIGSLWYVQLTFLERQYFYVSGFMILAQSFIYTKTVRDEEDATKWNNDFNNHSD